MGNCWFYCALWIVSFLQIETSATSFMLAAVAAFVLGIYAFTLPKCPPKVDGKKKILVEHWGLNALPCLEITKMAIFFIFAMFLGGALQLTNAYGDTFLHDFEKVPEFTKTLLR